MGGRGHDAGRWPPNLLLGDGAAEVIDGMGVVSKRKASVTHRNGVSGVAYGQMRPWTSVAPSRDGYASEFFPSFHYTPKASRSEREAGLAEAGIEPMTRADVTGRDEVSDGLDNPRAGTRQQGEIRNTHPTVKPISIMQWLVRIVSPPRSLSPLILDPFAGSGSTGVACVREGVRFVGVELDERHVAIARARIAHALKAQPKSDDGPQVSLFDP
jgi:site-specific DNA-methyltransferase (adenine-specific)